MSRVRLTSAAERDVREAAGWYRDQNPGLDLRFRDSIRTALRRIAERPTLYAEVHRDIRRALAQPFPYSIFYRLRDDQVLVVAVVHQARDPAIWQRR